MCKKMFIALVILLAFSMGCLADIIYLKSGRQLEVDNAVVVGDKVVFTVFNGRMSIALSAVSKIEKTEGPADPRAGLRDTIGKPSLLAASSSTTSPLTSEGGDDNQNASEEAVKFYSDKRLRLLKELLNASEQIKTLQSTIFAKSAINASTEQDRSRLLNFQRDQKEIRARLEEIPYDARKAGLAPGEIREIENTRLEQREAATNGVSTIIGNEDKEDKFRNADVKMSDGSEDEDSFRNSDVELKEDPATIK